MTARGTSNPEGKIRELKVPYWLSAKARRRQEHIEIGDYVMVSGLPDRKFQLTDIMWKYGSVRVREIGRTDSMSMSMPWRFIRPWEKEVIRSKTVMMAVGNFLFLGNRVYRLNDPDTVLTVKRIHWDNESSDLQDERGRIYYRVPWDEIEFLHPEDYHLPDDE